MASLPPLKLLLKTFQQPTWLAVFTSAGIHGALFAASPSFSSSALTSWANPGQLNRPHTVPLIELSAEEQSRLPNFSDQSLSLFPEFNQDELFNIPTTSPPDLPDPFTSDLSTGGLTPDWLGQSPFQRQTTQILPPPSSIPLDPFTGTLPPFPFLNQTPDSLTTVNSDTASSLEAASEETAAQAVDQAGEENAEQSAGAIADNSVQSSERAAPHGLSKLSSDELNQRVGDLGSWQIAGRTSGLLSLTPVAPSNGPELAMPDEGTELSFNLIGHESLQARLQAYAYNADGTSEEAASEALSAWTAEIQAESDIADLHPALVELPPIDNPVRVCLPQAPTSAMIGVLINPEGQVIDPPRLIKSTGYGALNNWAARSLGQSLENQDFSQVGAYQAFSFAIPIDYDAESCVDRARLTQPKG